MSPWALIRWSGLPTILAGVLIALFPFLHPPHDPEGYRSAAWAPVHLMPYIGLVLALLGLMGLFAGQLQRGGRLGLTGFLTAFIGAALTLTGAAQEAFDLPFIAAQAPQLAEGEPPGLPFLIFTSVLFSLGFILLGIAIARAGVFPRAAGVLLAVSAPVWAFAGPLLPEWVFTVGSVLFAIGLVWLGSTLWAGVAEQQVAGAVRGTGPAY